jgi:hypothetical protein
MTKKTKNILLGIAVAVIFVVRIAGTATAFNYAFYIGAAAMAAVEGFYLWRNHKELEENERVNELFYLIAIGIVILCKLIFFR